MRDAKLLGHFRRAVMLTLALPACGGATSTQEPTPAADGGTALPTTPCGWSEGPRAACSWSRTFQGDTVACTGIAQSQTATGALCLDACGTTTAGQAADTCSVGPASTGGNVLTCSASTGACHPAIAPGNGGRRSEYFAALGFSRAPVGRELGTHFARVACMEAGSVEAFRAMKAELVAHGAPKRLVRAASRAVRDEMRHVRQTSALARRFGAEPIALVPAPPRPPRDVATMAMENAIEGCVRETYSALECAWQAEAAEDPVVRATMKRIAKDELRHLALAWAVHAWALGRLDGAARARIVAAQESEVATLLAELAEDPAPALLRAGGIPRAAQSRALVDAIAERVRGGARGPDARAAA